MEDTQLKSLTDRVISAWNNQDVEQVVACYSDDLFYLDPNTRGPVQGSDAMRRYLSKLFSKWQMHWSVREEFPLQDEEGYAVLWHASFKAKDGDKTAEVDGMDLVLLDNDRIRRNEVYFDRAALASLAS